MEGECGRHVRRDGLLATSDTAQTLEATKRCYAHAHKDSRGGIIAVTTRRAEEGEGKRASVCEWARVVPEGEGVTPGLLMTGAWVGARRPLEASMASRRRAGRAAQTIDRSPADSFVALALPRPITVTRQTIHSLSRPVNLLHATILV